VGQDSIDAPIDGFMLAKKPKNLDGAKKLIGYFGTAQAINIYNPLNPGNLAVNKHANKSHYSPLQKKEAALIADQAHRAVHGPRHAARLRVHGDDPVAADVPEQPERRQRARQEHPEAEEGDLRIVTL
jgi:hypothetical protein